MFRFSLRSGALPLLILASLASSPAAHADGQEWDWDWETGYRAWREDSLNWASAIHPQHPSPMLLLLTTEPPPRELWCAFDDQPSTTDLQYFEGLLNDWSHQFLGIPPGQPLPPYILPSFPEEC